MRILIAIGVPRQEEAGAAGVVINHARELTKRGHRVDCWFLEDVLKKPARPKRLEALIFAGSLAKRILRSREKYDVVNIHAPWGCVYGFARKFLRPSSPPYALTMHGSEGRYLQAMLLEERKGRATNFAWKNRAWHRVYHQPMYNGSIKTAECGMVVSEEGRQYAEQIGKAKPGRFRFVPNGVDEKFFSPRQYAEASSRRLLYVGSWIDRKGVFYLAEAFQLLAKNVAGVRLTVAGCFAPENVVKSFFAPEVRDLVSVIPFVGRAEMPALYAQHDIFVFPSLVEGMPLTLLEAMAAAIPVVTTNVCGMADVVQDGSNGVLVSPADAKSLAEAIEKLCGSAELRKRLGAHAQETMRRYTWDRVVEGVESVLLGASNAKAASVPDARSSGAR